MSVWLLYVSFDSQTTLGIGKEVKSKSKEKSELGEHWDVMNEEGEELEDKEN